jgi:DNA-binding MarR family transcriptional regulator
MVWMSKTAKKQKTETGAKGIARALTDIFPRMLLNMSRLGGTQSGNTLTLTPAQLRALIALDVESRPVRMSALAEALGVTQSTTTDVTKRLMRMGYLTKERLPGDERVVCVSLSERGRKIVKELRGEKFRQFLKICEALPETEQQRLLKSHQLILRIYSTM